MKYEITAKRLQMALNQADMKAAELAVRANILPSSLSHYINGTHAPSSFSAMAMADVLNVSPVWLLGFDVPMDTTLIELEPIVKTFDEDQKKHLLAYAKMLQKLGDEDGK